MNTAGSAISVLDLFTIGIGPSSSHTVGPMKAAAKFARALGGLGVVEVRCDLFGSLADTGKGHGTDRAVILGLMGHEPATIDLDRIDDWLRELGETKRIWLASGDWVRFEEREHVVFHRGKVMAGHSNTMHFTAIGEGGEILRERVYYSIGGGFVLEEGDEAGLPSMARWPNPFRSGDELLRGCRESGLGIAELVLKNESIYRSESETRARIDDLWRVMEEVIERGLGAEGILPGGLKVKRRAKEFHRSLLKSSEGEIDPLLAMDWVDLYALAVNEENAAGGRVVTAPTNGAAGVIPAVLKYAMTFCRSPYDDGLHRFFLTAGAIGYLFKENASISGADVGCQGEVGVACSMAAGALTEFLGGTPEQVEMAAEIGMEHNLGLTCDPIGGLVQIPCIERNAMGAVKAINASRLAMRSGGEHHVSLDKVIRVMKATGRDMDLKYKETARGGLAVNVTEC